MCIRDSVPCSFVSPNPKRARGNTSNSVLDYDQYMTATTVDEFFSRKGNWQHLKYDVQRGYCTLDAAQLDACWRSVRSAVVPKAARAPKKKTIEVVDADGRGIVVESRTRGKKRRIVFDPSPESPDAPPPPPKQKPPQKRVGNFANSEEVYALLPAKPTDWPKELGQALRAARVPCAFVSPNPKRARGNTSNSVLDYDQYMTATTVDEFFSRKGNWGHLKYDVQCVAASS